MATIAPPKPGSPYDSDEDERHAPDGSHDSLGVNPEFRKAQEDDLEALHNAESAPEVTYGSEPKSKSAEELNDGEAQSPTDQVGSGFNDDRKPKRGIMAQLQGNPKVKKQLMVAGGIVGGFMTIVVLIFLFVILLSFLKIPGLKQNIINFQMTRMSRQFADVTTRNTETALAVEAATEGAGGTKANPGGLYGALKGKWQGLQDNMWKKFDNILPGDATSKTLIPSRVVQTLGSDNGLTFNSRTSRITGRQILQSMTLDGKTYQLNQATGVAKWTPLLKNWVSLKNRVEFANTVIPALDSAMGANGVPVIIRGLVAVNLRSIDKIFLFAWILDQFKGKLSPTASRLVEARAKYTAISGETTKAPDNAATATIADAENAAAQTEAADVANDKKLQNIINNGGVDQDAINAASSKLQGSLLRRGLVVVGGGVVDLVVSGCIIYDASVQRSGPTIDNQVNQQRAAFYYVGSGADQQESGSLKASTAPQLTAAISATNDDLGDTNVSDAYRAGYNHGTIDTTSELGGQAGSGGGYTYSILDALGITSGVAGRLVNSLMNTTCPALTSTATAAAVAAASVAFSVASFGSAGVGANALSQGAGIFIKAYMKHVTESLFGDVTVKKGVTVLTKSFIVRAKPYIAKQGVILAGTAGLAELANIVTHTRAAELQGGLNQGQDLANEANAGAGEVQGDIEQSQLFGRPLLKNEVCQSNQEDIVFMNVQTSSRSAYDRYLSPNYADSLLSRSAVAVDYHLGNFPNKIPMAFGSFMLQPFRSFNTLFALFTGKSGAAVCQDADSSNYGDVQFGWSQAEENLISTGDPAVVGDGNEISYMPLENQQVLDNNAGKEDAIAQKYAICFGYRYNSGGDGSLDPTDENGNLVLDSAPGGSASIGTLLSGNNGAVSPPYIVRDQNHANVVNGGGLCDPANLSYNSTDSLAADSDGSSPERKDLIFRWRIAMQNDTTISIMHNLQYVTN